VIQCFNLKVFFKCTNKHVSSNILSQPRTLADFDYSHLLCTIDLVVKPSKPAVVYEHTLPASATLQPNTLWVVGGRALNNCCCPHQVRRLKLSLQYKETQFNHESRKREKEYERLKQKLGQVGF